MANITTTELAAELDTTPRELRKFLRSEGRGVGKGSRYSLPGTKREIAALAKRYATWAQAQAEAREARKTAQETADDTEAVENDDMTLEEIAEQVVEHEPTDEELEEIERLTD